MFAATIREQHAQWTDGSRLTPTTTKVPIHYYSERLAPLDQLKHAAMPILLLRASQVQVCFPFAVEGCEEAAYFLNNRQATLIEALRLGQQGGGLEARETDASSVVPEGMSVASSFVGTR